MYHHCPSFAIKQINVVLGPYGSLIIRDGSYSMLQLVKRMRSGRAVSSGLVKR